MNSPERQAEMKYLIDRLQAVLKELEAARKRDAIFEERKKLYLEMKELNNRLQLCLANSDTTSPE